MWAGLKSLFLKILHADDSPGKIAWGVAIGIFVAWTPTIGLQMYIAGVLAWILRGNIAGAVAVVWLTNPYTAIPVYWFNYIVGYYLVGGPWVDWSWFVDFISSEGTRSWSEYMRYAYTKMAEIFWPLWIGSFVVGFVLAVFSYFGTFYGVKAYRAHKLAKKSRELANPLVNAPVSVK